MSRKPTMFVTVDALYVQQRLDNFLLRHLKGLPKSRLYRIIRKGEVRVNKGRIKPHYRLQLGDIVRIPPMEYSDKPTKTPPSKNALTVLKNSVIFEDQELLVINKPSGMAVHGGSGINFGVIEGLRALYPNAPYLELVHRLDRDTSGCLMIAKKPAILRQLHQLLRERKMQKRYLALVKGQWPTRLGCINAPLRKKNCPSGERIVKVDPDGKKSRSYFTLKKRFAKAPVSVSLVEVKIVTGRTHQIRVHSAFAKHPVIGDSKYGDEKMNLKIQKMGCKRLFLHASSLIVTLANREKPLELLAPLPQDLKQLLKRLDENN